MKNNLSYNWAISLSEWEIYYAIFPIIVGVILFFILKKTKFAKGLLLLFSGSGLLLFLSGLMTPPDIFSQALMGVPMIIAYILGFIARSVLK